LTTSVNSRWQGVHKRHGDATVLKQFFTIDITSFFVIVQKEYHFLESVNFSKYVYMQLFNFRDGHVITFRHTSGSYICQMPSNKRSRLRKGSPEESGLCTGTIGLGENCFVYAVRRIVVRYPQKRIMLFLDLSPPTLQNSGIFHDSTRSYLHFDGLPPKPRRSVVSIQELRFVTSSLLQKRRRSGLAWSRPRADRGLSRLTSVFLTTIDVCKIVSRSVEIWQY